MLPIYKGESVYNGDFVVISPIGNQLTMRPDTRKPAPTHEEVLWTRIALIIDAVQVSSGVWRVWRVGEAHVSLFHVRVTPPVEAKIEVTPA